MIWQVSITGVASELGGHLLGFTWRGVSVAFRLEAAHERDVRRRELARELGELGAKLRDDADEARAALPAHERLLGGGGREEDRDELAARVAQQHEEILGKGSLFFGRNPAMSYTTSPA